MLDYANTDSRTPTVIPYKPGDQAIKADQKYPAKGEKFSIYGNQVFDVIYALDADHIYYGKIVITQLEFKGKGKFAPAKVAITIIMQPTAGNTQY